MQNPLTVPRSWLDLLWYLLVAIFASSGTWVVTWFRRKQSEAETEKTRAETRSIEVDTSIQTSNFMNDLAKAAAQATLDVARLRVQMEFQRARADRLEAERDLLQFQLDEHIRIGKPKN